MCSEWKRRDWKCEKNFFNVRAAGVWNNVPDAVREKKTVNGFKAAYDKWKSGTLSKV